MDAVFSDERVLSRYLPLFAERQNRMAAELLLDCVPYVPYDTGALCESGHVISGDADTPAYLVWDKPYARAVYYGDTRGVTFHTEHHPHASARWFEKIRPRFV